MNDSLRIITQWLVIPDVCENIQLVYYRITFFMHFFLPLIWMKIISYLIITYY